MSGKRFSALAVFMSIFILAGCGSATPAAIPAPTEAPTEKPTEAATEATTPETGVQTTITLGDVGNDPGVIIDGTQPLADYIAKNLATFAITKGQVKVVSSPDEMTHALQDGEVDLYFDSVYPAALISEASGAKPFIRRWKDGVEKYHTVIFAAKSSGITDVKGLTGHMMGFDNEFSTSGYVLPYAYLSEAGLTLTRKESPTDAIDSGEVGYTFSDADQNTIQWVLSGRVAAAATDNVKYENLPADVKDQLVILAETEPLPRQVGIIRPGMNEELKSALVEVLIHAHEDVEGQQALESFQGTAKFDEFPEGIDKALERIQELVVIIDEAKSK